MTWLGWLVVGVIFGSVAGLLGYRALSGRKQAGYLAHLEYWVYTDQESLPKQELIMDQMISSNPHNRRGKPCIGAREGMLFTDIRLHMGVAKRGKNPHAFRPDLFQDDVVPTREILERLADAPAMVRVRYLSEVPLKDTRHLQFLPHLAETVSRLMDGKVVFDVAREELYAAEDFHRFLSENGNCERPEFHIRVLWKEDSLGFRAETRGLRKVGLPEMKSDPQERDTEVLITGLMTRLAFARLRKPEETGPWEFDEYGDAFVLRLGEIKEGRQIVHFARKLGAEGA